MKLLTYLTHYFESKAKRDVLEQLRSMPERQLLDCGFSPDLIKEGVAGWPWRMQAEPSEPLRFKRTSGNSVLHGESERGTTSTRENESVSQDAAA